MNRLFPAVALLLTTAALGFAYPKPSDHKISWEIDVEHGTPTRIVVQEPGSTVAKAYWYIPIRVTNNTDADQLFLPVCEMVDDKGNVHRSDKQLPRAVFEAVKNREGKKLMEPLSAASGTLRVGKDQARDTVAIWPEPMPRMGTFTIFISGLSGETVWYKDGKEIPMRQADWTKVKPEQAGEILRKTLSLEYHVPGDEFSSATARVELKKKDWVMR